MASVSAAIPGIAVLAFWQVVASRSPRVRFLFSSPEDVARSFIDAIADGGLISDAWLTGTEALLGLLLGVGAGTLTGLSLTGSVRLAKVIRPYLTLLSAVPVFAVAPMTVIWFGTGYGAKVAMAFIATVFFATGQAYTGARTVDPELAAVVKAMGGTRLRVYWLVIVPAALTWVLSSARMSVGLALTGAFIGEFISSTQGLGFRILRASGLYDVAGVLTGVVMMALLGLAMTGVVNQIEAKAMSWRESMIQV